MTENRRPLKSRGTGWARSLAAGLARIGVSPDAVSAASVVLAGLGFWAFWNSAEAEGAVRAGWLLAAGLTIQFRLLANLLDGMVAVEHGRGGPVGPIWNELPDRIADVLFLVGAGYALRVYDPLFGPVLGWTAAVLAVTTAYVRELGQALGQAPDFVGPGAKPHRMAVLTAGCGLAALLSIGSDWAWSALWLALAVIVILSAATVVRRTLRLAASLRSGWQP
jgi:phosphatidylglycerophosphate synthase